ncbi:MAG: hypothetical protein ACK4OP_15695 [Gemmobacter sp.]
MTDVPAITALVVMRRADGRSILDIEGPVTATSANRTAGDLPPDRIAEVRRRLTEAGFAVAGGNDNTLSITGPAALFAETFGLDPAAATDAGRPAHATRIRPDLEPYVADVFVPPRPTFFD